MKMPALEVVAKSLCMHIAMAFLNVYMGNLGITAALRQNKHSDSRRDRHVRCNI